MVEQVKHPFLEDMEKRLRGLPHNLAGFVQDPRLGEIVDSVGDDPYATDSVGELSEIGKIGEEKYGVPKAYAREVSNYVSMMKIISPSQSIENGQA